MEFAKKNAHWLLRAAFAAVFLFHGLSKFPVAGAMAGMMGMPVIAVYMLALMETMAGVLVLHGGLGNGLATKVGGALIVPVMLGAIMMLHAGQWSFMPTEQFPAGGMEFQVVLIGLSLYFLFKGNDI